MRKQSKYLPAGFHALSVALLLSIVLLGCKGNPSSITSPTGSAHHIEYIGNNNTGGAVPTDLTSYKQGDNVTVLGNSGSLTRTGYAFSGWNDKADGSGAAYASGTTFVMGAANITLYAQWTKNSNVGQMTTIYSFGASGADGQNPWSGVMIGTDGYLYGTTRSGGPNGTGTVFKVSTSGVESVLYSFAVNGGPGGDARFSVGGVAMDSHGNLWGTATYGGQDNTGNGVVFEISAAGIETLYSLNSSSIDGKIPMSTPIVDANDNVYGTTMESSRYGRFRRQCRRGI